MLYLVPPSPRPRGFRPRYRPNVAIRAVRTAGRGLMWAAFQVRVAYLRFCMWDLRRYLNECAADGLTESLSLTEFNRQYDDMQARVMLLRAGSWA